MATTGRLGPVPGRRARNEGNKWLLTSTPAIFGAIELQMARCAIGNATPLFRPAGRHDAAGRDGRRGHQREPLA